MEKQEWQGYVQKVASCDYPIPLNLINDYDDWKCRSNVGRMLMILKDIEGAGGAGNREGCAAGYGGCTGVRTQ